MKKVKRNGVLWLMSCILVHIVSNPVYAQQIYFEKGYAHNNYMHKKPLFDALDNGYTHIEADIFLLKGSLVIAH